MEAEKKSPTSPKCISKNMYLAVTLVIIIILIGYCFWYKPWSAVVGAAIERLDQPTSHTITDMATMTMIYYRVPEYVSPSATTSIVEPTVEISPTGTRGQLGYTVRKDWFSGVRAKKSVILARVNSPCKLATLDMTGTVKDQGWGNYCGRVGIEVTRNEQVVYRADARTNIPELRRGWLDLRYMGSAIDSQGQNVSLQEGDVISVFIQGLWPGCSASAKHSLHFSMGIEGANSESITPGPGVGYFFR
jgi:hypothetical protein